MATTIKYRTHIEGALRFLDTYGVSTDTTNLLYLGTGRTTAWPDEANPPTPTDRQSEEDDFWTNLIGMKRVDTTRMTAVVPRYDWTIDQLYVTFDITDVNAYNTKFYVLNSENRVYKCTASTGGTPADEPLETNEDGNGVITVAADGYAWEFLYVLSLFSLQNLLSDAWLPVNYNETILPNGGGGEVYTRDLQSVYTLGSKYALVQVSLEDTDTQVGAVDTTYRQTSIISNPISSIDDTTALSATLAATADVTTNSGHMLHLENKGVITRATGQTEVVQTVLQF